MGLGRAKTDGFRMGMTCMLPCGVSWMTVRQIFQIFLNPFTKDFLLVCFPSSLTFWIVINHWSPPSDTHEKEEV